MCIIGYQPDACIGVLYIHYCKSYVATQRGMCNNCLQVILGGMLYDNELKRGVRRRYLPEPNPQKVELPRHAKLTDVFEKAKYLYFNEVETDTKSMCLCDSSGVLIPVNADSWTLASFYQKNNLQPSRYKLYVTVTNESVSVSIKFQFSCYCCVTSQVKVEQNNPPKRGNLHILCCMFM